LFFNYSFVTLVYFVVIRILICEDERMNIILVCTGNTCRSPMAEGLLRRKAAEVGLADRLQISSAGVAAVDNLAPSAHAVVVMGKRGIDISAHRSRQLREHMAATADLILTMTAAHKRELIFTLPEYVDRTHTLHEWAGLTGAVQDPFGGPLARYEACAAQLSELIDRIWPQLLSRVEKKEDRKAL